MLRLCYNESGTGDQAVNPTNLSGNRRSVMTRINLIAILCLICTAFTMSCSSGAENPVSPDPAVRNQSLLHRNSTRLWGYYECVLDPQAGTISVTPNRHAMFTMNLVQMLNNNPSALAIHVNNFTPDVDYVDVDFDVSITHPIYGAPHLNVYDVRGIFIGNEGATCFPDFGVNMGFNGYPHYQPSTFYDGQPGYPGSQEMMDDPVNLDGGGPDGYTRWYNPKFFTTEGLFGYTQGIFASDKYAEFYYWASVLNPYKLFADGLGVHDGIIEWLDANPTTDRVFSSGATNTRNYYVRFSKTAVEFAYSVTANWEAADVHPSNQREAIACEKIYATEHPDYFVFEFKVIDPLSDVDLDTGIMDDYILHLVIVSNHGTGGTFLQEFNMVPMEVGDNYAIFHHEIPTAILQIDNAYDFWVIPRYPGYDYSNPFGVPNEMVGEDLAAWFCFELDKSDEPWD